MFKKKIQKVVSSTYTRAWKIEQGMQYIIWVSFKKYV